MFKMHIQLCILDNSLNFLWKHQYIHRDIKPQNILAHIGLKNQLVMKIGDLGSSKKLQPIQVSGTALYKVISKKSSFLNKITLFYISASIITNFQKIRNRINKIFE